MFLPIGSNFLPVQSKEDHFWIKYCHSTPKLPFLIFVFIVGRLNKMKVLPCNMENTCATVILLPFQLLLPTKKQWLVSTCNNFKPVFFIKSLLRKRPYLIFCTINSDFFQGSVIKEQLQHSFPKGCEQVWPAQNRNWFCSNQIFPLNSFPTKILRYSTLFSGLHRYKEPWKQGCELVSLSTNIPGAFTGRIFGRIDFFHCLL